MFGLNALWWTLGEMGVSLLLSILIALKSQKRGVGAWVLHLIGAPFLFLVNFWYFYNQQPTLGMGFWGHWYLPVFLFAVPTLVFAAIMLGIGANIKQKSKGRSRWDYDSEKWVFNDYFASGVSSGVLLVSILLLMLVVSCSQNYQENHFIGDNSPAKYRANLANIQYAANGQRMPATDVSHIVMVTPDMATAAARQAIARAGGNLGAIYNIAGTTLQSVNKHLYYIAYLDFANSQGNQDANTSPGYIAVDAEDPNAATTPHLGLHLVYLPNNDFPYAMGFIGTGQNDLIRWVYGHGYNHCDLVDPTIEVDDKWVPYFTISCDVLTQADIAPVVQSVITVDPQSGDIHNYPLGQEPAWIDRVIPFEMVKQYVDDWGQYHAGLYWTWFGSQAHKQQAATDPIIVYNNADQPVWVIPMTSTNDNDNSSTGVILYSTHDHKGTFYNFAGYAVGDVISQLFDHAGTNIKGYDANTPQLYTLYGQPTWVTIYTRSVKNGETYAGIGFLDATHPSAANVVTSLKSDGTTSSKEDTLLAYQQVLAAESNGQSTTAAGNPGKQISGTVFRVNCAGTSCHIMLVGDKHIFTGDASKLPYLSLVQPGDKVSLTYLDTQQTIQALDTFTDDTIQANIKQ